MTFPFYAKFEINDELKYVEVHGISHVKHPKIFVNISHGKLKYIVDTTLLIKYICDEATYAALKYCIEE